MPEWTLAVPEAAELVVVPWLGAIFATSNGNIIDDFTTTKVIHSKYYEDSREAKGQIISEHICGVLKFSKKATKYCQDFFPSL